MMKQRVAGCIRLFSVAGIAVHLHWTWFFVLVVLPYLHAYHHYDSYLWAGLELLAIFAIVTLHEFGHAFAARMVGGQAKTIVLLPIGGITMVTAPLRPGALFVSLAGGPLVNVLLIPVLMTPLVLFVPLSEISLHPKAAQHDGVTLLVWLSVINLAVLVFNMLPIYPLDGGRILRALLWFVVGRGPSLKIASAIGWLCAGGVAIAALVLGDSMLLIVGVFFVWQAWRGARLAELFELDRLRAGEEDEAVGVEGETPEDEPADAEPTAKQASREARL